MSLTELIFGYGMNVSYVSGMKVSLISKNFDFVKCKIQCFSSPLSFVEQKGHSRFSHTVLFHFQLETYEPRS